MRRRTRAPKSPEKEGSRPRRAGCLRASLQVRVTHVLRRTRRRAGVSRDLDPSIRLPPALGVIRHQRLRFAAADGLQSRGAHTLSSGGRSSRAQGDGVHELRGTEFTSSEAETFRLRESIGHESIARCSTDDRCCRLPPIQPLVTRRCSEASSRSANASVPITVLLRAARRIASFSRGATADAQNC